MRIYFVHSSSYEDILREVNVRVLVNFDYFVGKDIPYGFKNVLIDSGGFQIQTGSNYDAYMQSTLEPYKVGDRIDKEKLSKEDLYKYLKGELKFVWKKRPTVYPYAYWLKEILPKHPEVDGYFNLDIFGDGDKTLENQFSLEAEGLSPIPIWHFGEGEEYLKFYYDNYPWIGVGGLVANMSEVAPLVSLLHQKYPDRKYHFLGTGLSGTKLFKEWVPYSTDFSTWSTVARFGHAIVDDPDRIIKEVVLPLEIRQQIRTDNKLLRSYLLDAVKKIEKLEVLMETVKKDTYQVRMDM